MTGAKKSIALLLLILGIAAATTVAWSLWTAKHGGEHISEVTISVDGERCTTRSRDGKTLVVTKCEPETAPAAAE